MHENKKGFTCEFCGMKFNDNSSLKSHIYFEHANNRWKCEPCQLAFQKYHQLRQHNYYVHSTKVHTCNFCGKTYKRKSDHTEHIKRKHMEKVSQYSNQDVIFSACSGGCKTKRWASMQDRTILISKFKLAQPQVLIMATVIS